MAHFAKLGKGDKVIGVYTLHNDIATSEQAGVDFLNNLYKINAVWKQTSYNTRGGVHQLGGTPFRKNYAGKNFKYDVERDAFIEPQPYNSWTLNEDTCRWDPPVAYPDDGKRYAWNEATISWKEQKA